MNIISMKTKWLPEQSPFYRTTSIDFTLISPSLSLCGVTGGIYLYMHSKYQPPPTSSHSKTTYTHKQTLHMESRYIQTPRYTHADSCNGRKRDQRSPLTKAIWRLKRNFLMCFHWGSTYLLYMYFLWWCLAADDNKWGNPACISLINCMCPQFNSVPSGQSPD